MRQIRKSVFTVLGIVAVLALGAAANADLAQKPWTDFDHKYDMSSDPTTDGGLYLGGSSTLTTDGSLQVADMTGFYGDDGDGGNIWQGNFSDNPGYTIETRLKVSSMGVGKYGAWAISASAAEGKWVTVVYIGDSFVSYDDQQLGRTTVDTSSNIDAYHVFRATFDTVSGGINLWRDGIKIGDEVTPLGAQSYNANILYLGAAWTGNVAGETLVDYMAVTPGVWAPVPEPCGITLIVSALVGLLAYAWRKRR
jgi:hypothetical protein